MILGVIPARFASSRFPGKPLADIAGKSMIQRVYESASQSTLISKIIVATDDSRIADHVFSFGGNVEITKQDHPSGTDRCFEVLSRFSNQFSYVVNIQGDEPFLDPQQIDELAAQCDGTNELITQMIPVSDFETLFDEGEVKIALNQNNEALYFSRSVIPFIKNIEKEKWHAHHNFYRHVGMYAYRCDVLEKISQLQPSSLERAESLEQLRWLEAGFKIKCIETKFDSYCVDFPNDIEKILQLKGIQLK